MNVINTKIPELVIIEPNIFGDERGFFFESYNHEKFVKSIGYEVNFVQDNHSKSSKDVLRGLHYQMPPNAQGKLVRVVSGKVLDVAADIRKSSNTFGQYVAVELSAENKRQFWIPPGFAHGFLTLSDNAEFLYKTTDYYAPDSERIIAWNDPQINVNWGIASPLLSEKDSLAPTLDSAEVFD